MTQDRYYVQQDNWNTQNATFQAKSPDINVLLRRMTEAGASDLHLKVGSPPALRVDGELEILKDLPELKAEDMNAALAIIATDNQVSALYKDLELDFSYALPGVARFRVNAGFQRENITMVFRRLSIKIPTIDDLGLPDLCKELVSKPRGLILVTGPTGSGKSTTLAAMIDYINTNVARRVITIEDPIEYVFEDKRCLVTQRELGPDTHSFASALKHALRQDPDVILVGEMRDLETISTALTAAETGHLVLSTLHTAGAALTMDRIIDVFPPHQQQQVRTQLSNIIEGVLSQTLVPLVEGTGRVAAIEVMVATSAVRNLIREAKTHQLPGVIETGARAGMQTLDQALISLFKAERISLEEALAKASNPQHFKQLVGAF